MNLELVSKMNSTISQLICPYDEQYLMKGRSANCTMCLPSGRRTEQSLRSPYESGFSMTVSNKPLGLPIWFHTLKLSPVTFHYWRQLWPSHIVRLMKAEVLIALTWMCDYVSVCVSGNRPWQRFHHPSPSDHQLQGTLWWILRTWLKSSSWIILKHIRTHTHIRIPKEKPRVTQLH